MNRQVQVSRQRGQLSRTLRDNVTDVTRGLAGPELDRDQFLATYGADEGEKRWQLWQAHRAKAPAYALVRGKSPAALDEAKAAYQGDRRILERVEAEDAAERRRDPAGYGLTFAAGYRQAYEQAQDPADKAALLWDAQGHAGIPETQRSPWTLEQSWDLARRWLAIEDRPTAAQARVDLVSEALMALPEEQRAGGLAAMAHMQLDGDAPGRLGGIYAALGRGSMGEAFAAASGQEGLRLQPQPIAFQQLAEAQEAPSDDAPDTVPKSEPSVPSAPTKTKWTFEEELKVLDITAEDPAFAGVPSTMAALIEGYNAAEGTFNGTPPDDEALMAVLRSLYLQKGGPREQLNNPLTDEEAQAVAAIYAIYEQQGIDPAFAAAERPMQEAVFEALTSTTAPPAKEGEEPVTAFRDRIQEWDKLDEQGKKQLLLDVAALVNEAYGLPSDYTIEFESLGEDGPYGQYRPEKTQEGSGRLILDLEKFDQTVGGDAIAKLLHELNHVHQAALMRAVVTRNIKADDPRYRQIELFIFSQGFYEKVSGPVRTEEAYYNDPREGHSQALYRAWRDYWDRANLPSD